MPRVIRRAVEGDYPLFSRFAELLDPTAQLPGEAWWARSHADGLFVEEDGAPIAFGYAFRLGDEGRVSDVVVEPAWRGRAIGRAIMDALAERLRGEGCTWWSLYVADDNDGAIALYRKCGMEVAFRSESIEIEIDRLRLEHDPPGDLTVCRLDPAADAAAESALSLPRGRLARLRRVPGRSIFAAHRGDRCVGVLGCNPDARLVPILKVDSVPAARLLLHHAREELAAVPAVRVHVDDDLALSAALKEAGGTLVSRMLRMEGPLRAPRGSV